MDMSDIKGAGNPARRPIVLDDGAVVTPPRVKYNSSEEFEAAVNRFPPVSQEYEDIVNRRSFSSSR